jgi:hypothetical protein
VTKHAKPTQPLSACDFTIELFCRIDNELKDVKKPVLSHLHPSEVVTVGVLQVLRRSGLACILPMAHQGVKELIPSFAGAIALVPLVEEVSAVGQALSG